MKPYYTVIPIWPDNFLSPPLSPVSFSLLLSLILSLSLSLHEVMNEQWFTWRARLLYTWLLYVSLLVEKLDVAFSLVCFYLVYGQGWSPYYRIRQKSASLFFLHVLWWVSFEFYRFLLTVNLCVSREYVLIKAILH